MAEGEDKTEDASPHRREEARKQGQVATSQEFTGAMLLLAGIIGLLYLGGSIGGGLLDLFRTDLPRLLYDDLDEVQAQAIFTRLFGRGMLILGSFLGLIVAVAILANILQVGFYITPERLEPDFERLSPVKGMEKLFSVAAVVKGLMATAKLTALGIIAYVILRNRAGSVLALSRGTLPEAIATAWGLVLRVSIFLAGAIAILGVIDFIYQRQRFEKTLRMTKQEVKEEHKREEGDPMIKSRIRQLGRERAKRRMLAAVPKATVIITNPTHYAVALRYDQTGTSKAPILVAKGVGHVAKTIIDIARRHAVPIIEKPPLAQALYKSVAEGKEIPAVLFQVVAEVLALVYRLREVVGGR